MTPVYFLARPIAAARPVLLALASLAGTPVSAPAEDALAERLDVRWEAVRLRESLARLGAATGLPVFVDRRVDNEFRASLSLEAAPLSEILDAATSPHGLGYATLGPVVYVGPAQSAAVLRRVGPEGRRPRVFRREAPLEWGRLAEPRQLIVNEMAEVGRRLENPDAIPHDLWPAGALPKMSRGDQLTLLLIGFDLTWAPSDRAGKWRVEPIDYAALPAPPATGQPRPSRSPRGKNSEADRRYTLRVTNQPLRAVLEQVAKRVGRELVFDASAASSADRRVSFAVSGATLEELVEAAAAAAGLRARVSGRAIHVEK